MWWEEEVEGVQVDGGGETPVGEEGVGLGAGVEGEGCEEGEVDD